jgi:hypothetical protein
MGYGSVGLKTRALFSLPSPATGKLQFVEADSNSMMIEACSPPDETISKESRQASVFDVNVGGEATVSWERERSTML